MFFPYYDFSKKALIPGTSYSCSPICTQNKVRCQKHYENLHQSGIFVCPYGFSTIVKGEFIFSGIGVEDYCDKAKIKRNGYCSRILSQQEASDIVNLEYERNLVEFNYNKIERLILELFHDVRKLNGTAKNNCQELLDSIEETDPKKKSLLNILDASNLISMRLSYYQFVVNPNFPVHNENVGIYRIFERSVQFFRNTTQSRYINVNLGNYWKGVQGQNFLSLVPYVIIENAVKYSPNNSEITIAFEEKGTDCTVTVTSLGPRVDATELDLIFKPGYRGSYAIKNQFYSGTGLGLAIVKDICDRHGFEVYARSTPQPFPVRHHDYYSFSISVVFHRIISIQDV